MIVPLYAGALLVSAFLLFWVQLLLGRLLLPVYGGSPAVWTTCLVFFQGALLGGYAYADGLRRLETGRAQVIVHACALALGALVLPLGVSFEGSVDSPVASVLVALAASVGLPFVVLSATAPLVQSWYGRLARPDSHDPYPLYAASNLGSLGALLVSPLLLERALGLGRQAQVWSVGYGLAAAALLGCGLWVWRAQPVGGPSAPPAAAPPPSWQTRLRWLVYAFVPAWLLYGVTSAITTDLAAVPLLWAVPLGLYLLSYVIAFRRGERRIPRSVAASLLAGVLMILALTSLVDLARFPVPWAWLGVHVLGVFGVSCFLHRDLADERPAVEHLTGFYLWVAAGGVLAGAFCALGAPLLFEWALEYPLGLLVALLLLPRNLGTDATRSRWPLRVLSFALGIVTVFALAGFDARGLRSQLWGYALLLLPVAWAIALAFPWGKLRALHVIVLGVLIGQCSLLGSAELLHRERSFFGVHRVLVQGEFVHYVSGSTVHGRQHTDPARKGEPLAYFARTAPLGQVFTEVAPVTSRVGVLGLGVGCLAAYAQEGQSWRFFEVDPAVVGIARDARFFSYLSDATAPVEVVVGDGRLSLAAEREAGAPRYDLLALDAFSSDAVPVHLLTREAFELYADRLSPRGVLVANVSNRFLDLEPLFARQATLGWTVIARRKAVLTDAERAAGEAPSHAVALSRDPGALGGLLEKGWRVLDPDPAGPAWTDDHADLLGVVDFAPSKR